MAHYVPDIKTQRWVVIAEDRKKRPSDVPPVATVAGKPVCPFCAGNESLTPPEVYRIGSGERETPGWQVRVVPNLFPITDTHEVIIHSTDHQKDIEELPLDQVKNILITYRDRYRVHDDDGQVLIFCNHGFHAGASLQHPHAQLVVVPKQINLDALSREPIANIVEDNTYFVTYCPDFSQWPFEVWIAPKSHANKFKDTSDDELHDLAVIHQRALRNIKKIYDDPQYKHVRSDAPFGYNYYIYHGANWYLRIIPRFVHRAGFELGTGLNVNTVDPREAAKILKDTNLVITN